MTSQFTIDDEYTCLTCFFSGNLDTLGLLDPEATFNDYSETLPLGNGMEKGMGWATAEWNWAAITAEQRAVLRSIVPGKSANVYITTQLQDGSFDTFSAIATWPENEEPPQKARGTFVITDFTLKFKDLVAT